MEDQIYYSHKVEGQKMQFFHRSHCRELEEKDRRRLSLILSCSSFSHSHTGEWGKSNNRKKAFAFLITVSWDANLRRALVYYGVGYCDWQFSGTELFSFVIVR